MAYVAGYQRIGVAGKSDLEKGQVIRVWQLRRTRTRGDEFPIGLELPQDLAPRSAGSKATRGRASTSAYSARIRPSNSNVISPEEET